MSVLDYSPDLHFFFLFQPKKEKEFLRVFLDQNLQVGLQNWRHKQSYWLVLSKFIDNRAHFCFVSNVKFTCTVAHFLVWYGCFHTSSRPYSGFTQQFFKQSTGTEQLCTHTNWTKCIWDSGVLRPGHLSVKMSFKTTLSIQWILSFYLLIFFCY